MTRYLIISEKGTALQIRKNCLCIRAFDGTETRIEPRTNLQTILICAEGFSLTQEAIRWASREGVMVIIAARSGEAITLISNDVSCDTRRKALRLREAQWQCFLNRETRFEIARSLVLEKIETLGLEPLLRRSFLRAAKASATLPELLTAEARATREYFRRFEGTRLNFAGDAPERWKTFLTRDAGARIRGRGGVSPARNASNPANAMLNYAYAIVLAQSTRALLVAGLEPSIGFLHSPKPGRLALSYDVLELLRARVTNEVFRWMAARKFEPNDFSLSREGIVSLEPKTARELARAILTRVPMPQVKRAVAWFERRLAAVKSPKRMR